MSYIPYLTLTRDELLSKLAYKCSDLASSYEEYAFTKSSELQEKASAWGNSEEVSVTAREKTATYSAMAATVSLLEIDGRIKSLVEERDFLRLLLTVER